MGRRAHPWFKASSDSWVVKLPLTDGRYRQHTLAYGQENRQAAYDAWHRLSGAGTRTTPGNRQEWTLGALVEAYGAADQSQVPVAREVPPGRSDRRMPVSAP